MAPLAGRRIALLESRKRDELSALVHRLGGVPISAPSVREIPRHQDVDAFVEALATRRVQVAIFLTGVGATALLDGAERLGRLPEMLAALGSMTVACRGPKPLGVMKKFGITPSIVTAKPHTTRELLDALGTVDFKGQGVLLAHYGEPSEEMAAALKARGALLSEVCPYEWALPEDVAPLTEVVTETVAGRIDAMLFTSQIQCRHLFRIADRLGSASTLADALNNDVVIGVVGPVSADALRSFGVTPDVMPDAPNMPSLIAAIADYFELTETD